MAPIDPNHPRAARSRVAIRAATRELLAAGGAGSVTHQRVAEAAGVGRATVYRHFPTVTDLVEDAFLAEGIPPLEVDVTGSAQEILRAAMDELVGELLDPGSLAVITTVLDQARVPGSARQLRDDYVGSLLEQLTALLSRISPPSANPSHLTTEQIFDLLVGPVLAQVLLRGARPSAEELDVIVAAALAAGRQGAVPTRPSSD